MFDGSLILLEAFLIWIKLTFVVGSIFFCCCSNFHELSTEDVVGGYGFWNDRAREVFDDVVVRFRRSFDYREYILFFCEW